MAKDPYRYFRVEARELVEGLTQGVLTLEKGAAAPEQVAQLLRLAHTLKGAARVVRQSAVAELAHATETALAEHRGGAQALPTAKASELLRLFDQMAELLRALDVAPAVAALPHGAARPAEEPPETARVELRELDALSRAASEAGVRVGALARDVDAADHLRDLARALCDQLAARPANAAAAATTAAERARGQAEELRAELERLVGELAADVQRVAGSVAAVGEVAHGLRLVPARSVFPALDRAVRDAAAALGKDVDLEAVGGEVQLDGNVLAALRDALMHVARNAVVHGVEAPAKRVTAGKPPRGRVRLVVERRGSQASFLCHDDGAGIDVDAVRGAALARGLLSPESARSSSVGDVLALLQAGGLTTAATVTELSGRGIGLDVVRATVARLRGVCRIVSESGRGTTVELQVPVSIASLPGLLVELPGGAAAAIPLASVTRTLRLEHAAIASTASGQSITHEDNVVPFLPLEQALRRARTRSSERRAWSAVIVRGGGGAVAIGVDRLLGTADIVLRALPATMQADPVVAGASLDADGVPQLVLDADGLVAAASRPPAAARDQTTPSRLPILVVDDSLTTRMLEQSILESAGYLVHLAVCAEDALDAARARRYGLLVVDVEMPGMDGFGLLAALQADPDLRDVPAILVTSRSAPEDRRRGEQVGARAYIVKAEFDQGRLLQTIRGLIG